MTNKVDRLTNEQARIFDLISDQIKINGYPPSNHEMASILKCTAQNINYHLQTMHRNGFIVNTPNIARGIKLINRGA